MPKSTFHIFGVCLQMDVGSGSADRRLHDLELQAKEAERRTQHAETKLAAAERRCGDMDAHQRAAEVRCCFSATLPAGLHGAKACQIALASAWRLLSCTTARWAAVSNDSQTPCTC